MLKIAALQIQSRCNPLGVDVPQPAFSWRFERSPERSVIQSAYRVLVSEEAGRVKQNLGDVWDSGKLDSRRSVGVRYEGEPLESRKRYYWKVQTWDAQGRFAESETAWWEMGLLHPSDWSAQWIGRDTNASSDSNMPLLRKEFSVERPVRRARAYVSGLGHYELRLNGEKVGNRVLEPGWTRYDKTCFYSVYDVSDLLDTGPNAVGLILGNGFFNVAGGRYAKFTDSFGQPKCRVQLEIDYTDGTAAMLASGDDWLVSASPLTFSCMYGGEDYDARLEQPGWDRPGFSPNPRWTRAATVPAPAGRLVCQTCDPLKTMKTFRPVDIKRLRAGTYIADFGQNFSGWVSLSVKGKQGADVKLMPAELLHEDGTANQSQTGTPYEWNYFLKGDGIEEWRPRFTYYGFRYIQIEGAAPQDFAGEDPDIPVLAEIKGEMIYPDIEASGSFESSDRLLGRIHEIINWAILSNMKSVFTDCPHREKLGWLEEVHLMGPSILYNYPIAPLLAKVMNDIRDAQLPDGMVPTTAPEYVVFEEPWDIFRHSVSWGATYILAGWMLFEGYGNAGPLEEHYSGMRQYIEFVLGRSERYIVKDGLGDWYDVGDEGPGYAQNTPVPLPETAMFYHIVDVFSRIAALLNRKEDMERYSRMAERIKVAYNEAFFDAPTCRYSTGSQAAQAMSLALGLVEPPHVAGVLARLAEDVAAHDGHTTAGDVGHRFVLLALAEHGRSDLVYKMAMKTDYPSYGYQIEHGATSLTEAWDGPTVGKSQNHFMLGHIEEWFYGGLAGYRYAFDPVLGAYRLTFRPHIQPGIDHVSVRHELPSGHAEINWERQANGHLRMTVEVPANASATVYVPSASEGGLEENGRPVALNPDVEFVGYSEKTVVVRIGSGRYVFTSLL